MNVHVCRSVNPAAGTPPLGPSGKDAAARAPAIAPEQSPSRLKATSLRRTSVNAIHSEGVEQAEPAEEYSAAAEAARQNMSESVVKKGCHPYRILLSDLVRKLRNTKNRMQALLSGNKPDNSEEWCAFQATPLCLLSPGCALQAAWQELADVWQCPRPCCAQMTHECLRALLGLRAAGGIFP
jgi:hypothetical protein